MFGVVDVGDVFEHDGVDDDGDDLDLDLLLFLPDLDPGWLVLGVPGGPAGQGDPGGLGGD